MTRGLGRLLTLLLIAVLAGCGPAVPRGDSGGTVEGSPRRIVSLAPSLTETLFALGVGDRVVGVTRYCSHPPEVAGLPRVGGHLDPAFEAIVALEPDLVVLIPSGEASGRRLEDLGVPVLRVDQHDVAAVLQSVTTLAEVCGVPGRGAALRDSMVESLQRVEGAVADLPRPRAVVVVGHEIGAGTVRAVWAAGPDTFYQDVLEIAGGVNAVEGAMVRYPEFSREGLAALDADVILDVVAGIEERGLDIGEIRRSWMLLRELRAVREGRVRVLEGEVMVVPGPRLPELVDAVARALHPELPEGGA